MAEIVFNSPTSEASLRSQIDSLQTTLASLNQQIIILQETLQERDQEIAGLKMRLSDPNPIVLGSQTSLLRLRSGSKTCEAIDGTLTIIGVLIKLYRFLSSPERFK